ncbi:RES domain-containing protein [Rhizobiales bacterium GAS191]|nr:RES domain-containing protein [Rhizobiales bacterium GAS191]
MRRGSGGPPPKGFASRDLVIAEIAPGGVWRRIYESRFSDPLGYGFGPSRFSDPKTMLVPPERFGVVYLGSSVKVCFAEAILRDRGVRRIKAFPLEWAELERWTCAELRIRKALRLVDLRGDGLLRMGVPTDVARASSQTLGRGWSRAFWAHDANPDGIVYESRLNGETNIALFDRALTKLVAAAMPRLVESRTELAAIITDFNLDIV